MRCFVAVCPDDAARAGLDRLASDLQRRCPVASRTRPENLHLTLAFIGAWPDDKAAQLANRLGTIAFEAFVWRVHRIGCFRAAHVVWAGGESAPLAALAAQVRASLQSWGVPHDQRAFAAHVSLLRDAPAQAPATAARMLDAVVPVHWRIDAIRLMASQCGPDGAVRYRPVPFS